MLQLISKIKEWCIYWCKSMFYFKTHAISLIFVTYYICDVIAIHHHSLSCESHLIMEDLKKNLLCDIFSQVIFIMEKGTWNSFLSFNLGYGIANMWTGLDSLVSSLTWLCIKIALNLLHLCILHSIYNIDLFFMLVRINMSI